MEADQLRTARRRYAVAVVIIPFRREHVNGVARLHCVGLSGLLSDLGIAAAKAFYTGCARTGLAVGFVYVEEGVVRGFALGSLHPDRLKADVLRKNPIGTVAGLCFGIARRPAALASLMKSFRGPDSGSYDSKAAELTYLAVTADSRGGGAGRQLVDAFTGAMRDAGAEEYELSVDEHNQTAIAFYERLGFQMTGRYTEFGILRRRYRLPIVRGAVEPR